MTGAWVGGPCESSHHAWVLRIELNQVYGSYILLLYYIYNLYQFIAIYFNLLIDTNIVVTTWVPFTKRLKQPVMLTLDL